MDGSQADNLKSQINPTATDASVTVEAAGSPAPTVAVVAPPAPVVDPDLEPDLEPDDVGQLYFDFIVDHFNALPEPIRRHLNSNRVAQDIQRIFQAANLTPDERDEVYAIVLKVFFNLVKVEDFPDELWTELAWPASEEDRCRQLAVDLLGYVMLPAQAFLGDVVRLIADFSVNPNDYPQGQVEARVMAFDEGAKAIAAAVDLPLDDEQRRRLHFIVESRLRDVRDDMETREMLARSQKVGGLELDEAAIEHVMEVLKAEMRMTRFVESVGEMPAPVVPVTPTAAAPAETPVPEAPSAQAAAPTAEAKEYDAAAIKAIYNGSVEERSEIGRRIAKFREVTGDAPAKERDALYEILYPPDLGPIEPLFVVAAALAMAEDGSLVSALGEDTRFRDLINKYFVDKHLPGEAFRFAETPTGREFMNVFLQILLRGFAGLPAGDAARFGLKVVNSLKKAGFADYSNLQAFDADEGVFRWSDSIEL